MTTETLPVPRDDRGLRLLAGGLALALGVAAFALQGSVPPRVQAVAGIVCFISLVAAFSSNL